jgi:hypothetical protein
MCRAVWVKRSPMLPPRVRVRTVLIALHVSRISVGSVISLDTVLMCAVSMFFPLLREEVQDRPDYLMVTTVLW